MMQSIHKSPLFSHQLNWPLRYGLINGFLFLCMLSLLLPAHAGTQSTNELRESVMVFLQAQMKKRAEEDFEVNVGRIDRRLTLEACQKAPAIFLAPGAKLQGKLTVGLRCSGPKPWTVYIPAQIKIFADVIAAAQPLQRGRQISAADVITVRQELSRLRGGYFTNSDEVIGKILTQNLAPGHAITPKRVKAPILVHRGEKVTLIATIGALKVRGKGEALRNAAQGELVSVRNNRSRRIVQGIVMKAGTVQIQM